MTVIFSRKHFPRKLSQRKILDVTAIRNSLMGISAPKRTQIKEKHKYRIPGVHHTPVITTLGCEKYDIITVIYRGRGDLECGSVVKVTVRIKSLVASTTITRCEKQLRGGGTRNRAMYKSDTRRLETNGCEAHNMTACFWQRSPVSRRQQRR